MRQLATADVVRLSGIGKRYAFREYYGKARLDNMQDFWALKDISLNIQEASVFGIIGRNGAGKTTLLKIIADTLPSTEGERFAKGRVVGLFNITAGFQDELSGRENIYLNGAILGATRQELDEKNSAIVEFSELGEFIDMPLGTYSQGMRLRLGFSIIANLYFDILVIDEILAVGDTLFQNKCFKHLMDLKRAGKTLIITSQSMDLIERLCDEVFLLDHGRLLFKGAPSEAIARYRALLNTERFYVGPQEHTGLITETKRWADDISGWGKKLGTKEVVIESVELRNRFGRRCEQTKGNAPLSVKVCFTVKNSVKEPHFGVAIFRKDGVYCYGPNTEFDGYRIPELKKGKGYFMLKYEKLLLAPGGYRISVAIWDKNETLAFDYHEGYYNLLVSGDKNYNGALSDIPTGSFLKRVFAKFGNTKLENRPGQDILTNVCGKAFKGPGPEITSLKVSKPGSEEKNIFITNDPIEISVKASKQAGFNKDYYIWLGVYRSDGIYCQDITMPLKQQSEYNVIISEAAFLPGAYYISSGVWDAANRQFIAYQHAQASFNMVFNRKDHGTVYMDHIWRWKIPD